MKTIFFLINILFLSIVTAQEKETAYILFEEKNLKNQKVEFNKGDYFNLHPHIHEHGFNRFEYHKEEHCKKKVKFEDFKSKLITKEEANKKSIAYLEAKSKEFTKKTGKDASPIIKDPLYDFSCFDKIFIYEKINEKEGYLYEVKYMYGIP